jgi:tetratricopeptide (TPR) repeat protein
MFARACVRSRLITIIGIALLASAHPLEVHGADRDYYNPGTGTDEVADWRNAHQFHLQPALDDMKRGAWGSARNNLEFILRHFPNSPQALNGISELCTVRWKSAQCDADSWMERAAAINPSIATTWVIYGIHLQRKRLHREAVDKFAHALELNPDNLNAHYNLGLAYFDLKEYDKANEQAQISYSLGAPLPGLRDMLKRAGAWKPTQTSTSRTGASKPSDSDLLPRTVN